MRTRLIAVLAAVALTGACGGGDTAGSERGVSVGDLQAEEFFYEGEYLGRTVTVSAAVAEVAGPRSVELSGGDFGDEQLLVVSNDPVSVAAGQVVRVTGTVGQLHRTTPADRVPYVQDSLYAQGATEAYLYDAIVEPLPTPAER